MKDTFYGEYHFLNSKCDPMKDRSNINHEFYTSLLDEVKMIVFDINMLIDPPAQPRPDSSVESC
jgi:hypothetical protein